MVGRLVVQSVSRSVGWSVGRPVGRPAGRSVGQPTDRSTCRSIGLPADGRPVGRSAGGSVGRPLVGGSFGVLVDRMTRNATCFANVGRLGRPVGQEVGRPVGWSVGRSIPATRSTRCLAHAGPGESAGRPVGRPGVRPVELSLRPFPLFPKEFFKIHKCKESY